jgi:peptide/nickel transport system permease protein
MLSYIGRRMLQIIPMWFMITIIIFFLIQLPAGDYVSRYIFNLESSGSIVNDNTAAMLRKQYGLDTPMIQQYFKWIEGIILHGNLGISYEYNRSVNEVLGDRLPLTIVLSIFTLLFTWIVSVPIGIYSAVHQYSKLDYIITFIGFIGISVPAFLIAIVIIYRFFIMTGIAYTGLFSPEYLLAPWSWAKVENLLQRIWLPVVIIGMTGTAAMIRTVRALMLDELGKQYVITARAKGMREWQMMIKYPIRITLNPIISTIGWVLPTIFAGESLVSIVLNLQTIGPIAISAMISQDMYLAASYLLITSTLTIIGTLISDILLVIVDPRIKFGALGRE